jgi:ribose-phosphate pyrophosphokinase
MISSNFSDTEVMQVYTPQTGCWSPITLSTYPDSTPLITRSILDEPVFKEFTILLRPRVFQDFIAAMFWVDAWQERFADSIINLVLPLVPGSRQDRLNDKGDFLFTAKSVARMINARCFYKVTILDPHSEVISALINNCNVVKPEQLYLFNPGMYDAVLSPDAGAEKRASGVANSLKIPLVHAWKKRDIKTGALCGFGYDKDVLGLNNKVLIVDDICDGGGTFLGLKEVLHPSLVVDLYVTFGLFTKGSKILTDRFNKVYTTDATTWKEYEQNPVSVHKICELLTIRNS